MSILRYAAAGTVLVGAWLIIDKARQSPTIVPPRGDMAVGALDQREPFDGLIAPWGFSLDHSDPFPDSMPTVVDLTELVESQFYPSALRLLQVAAQDEPDSLTAALKEYQSVAQDVRDRWQILAHRVGPEEAQETFDRWRGTLQVSEILERPMQPNEQLDGGISDHESPL